MSRGDGIKDILRLALIMQDSYQGLSIQDIQDEFDVSRSTAIRMKRIIEEVFAVDAVFDDLVVLVVLAFAIRLTLCAGSSSSPSSSF